MKKLTKVKKKEIEKFAFKHYKKLDCAHGIIHMKKTIRIAEYLAKKEGADLDLCRLGAILHQFHDRDRVNKFLVNIGAEKKLIKILGNIVYYSSMKNVKGSKTIEEKVVYDADKLQVVGPAGTVRELFCDFATRKRGFKKGVEFTRRIQEKVYKTIQTKTGKKIARETRKIDSMFWKIYDEWMEK